MGCVSLYPLAQWRTPSNSPSKDSTNRTRILLFGVVSRVPDRVENFPIFSAVYARVYQTRWDRCDEFDELETYEMLWRESEMKFASDDS